jgi:hypothetical protein
MSTGESKIFKGIKEEKFFWYLKFDGGLSNDIVYVVCSNQSMHRLEPIHYASNFRS